jgi:hypothetical protein
MPNDNKGVGKLAKCVKQAHGNAAKIAACEATFLQEPGATVVDPQEGGKVFTDQEGGKVFITNQGGKVF